MNTGFKGCDAEGVAITSCAPFNGAQDPFLPALLGELRYVGHPRVLRNFVNGEYVDARTESRTDVVNPSTGAVVASAPVSGEADVDAAYAAADAAFAEWGNTTPSERQQALLKIADALEARAEEFVRPSRRTPEDPGADHQRGEIPPMLDQIRFFAGARASSRAGRPAST